MSMAKKIAAILAKAQSTTFEGEAASLLAKAEELMKAHGIDLLDVDTTGDPMGVDPYSVRVSQEKWQRTLLCYVAAYYGAYAISHKIGRVRMMSISGKESARETTRVMWPYILKAVGRQASKLVKEEWFFVRQSIARQRIGDALSARINKLLLSRPNGMELSERAKISMLEQFKITNRKKPSIKIYDDAAKYAANIGLSLQTDSSGADIKRIENQ